MNNRRRQTWRAVGTGTLMLLSGCGGSDLTGYRPAREHSATASPRSAADPIVPERMTVAADHAGSPQPLTESPISEAEILPVSALVPVNILDGANVRALMSVPAVNSAASATASPPVAANAAAAVASSTEPQTRQIELLVKEKAFRTEPKTGAVRLSFDDLDLLKVLNMEPVVENAVELMPDWLRGIDGKLVRIRGFMYPTFDTEGIEHFVLARDNQICCFGRDPKVYDLVQVDMKSGKSTNYIPATRAFDVVGKFKIEMQFGEGKPFGLYSIEQAEVIDR